MTAKRLTVAITGAGGNLGSRLTAHLMARDWCEAIFALDRYPLAEAILGDKVTPVLCDIADAGDTRWHQAADSADAIVHFAAQNPAPNSSWSEAIAAFDMTLNLLLRAQKHPCRFVFASSNHAMGGYKDIDIPPPGRISGETPPLPGTSMFDGKEFVTSVGYGSSKLLGERACLAAALGSEGRLTAVSARIGWCMRPPNRPDRIVATGGSAGNSPATANAEQAARDLRWFRNMWLSDDDFTGEMEAAILADASAWPAPAVVVSGVSNNRGTLWDLEGLSRYLGYVPKDDVWGELEKLGVR